MKCHKKGGLALLEFIWLSFLDFRCLRGSGFIDQWCYHLEEAGVGDPGV